MSGVRGKLGRYVRSQLLLMLITFAELCVAFTLLGIDYGLLLSAATAVIDALPVFGVGTVLLPWAAYSFLMGNFSLGVGLVITYGAATVLRSCLQAKLLGDQLGLHPLVSLVSIYVGYRAMGVGGMILLPIAATVLKKLNDSKMLRLWRLPEPEGKETIV